MNGNGHYYLRVRGFIRGPFGVDQLLAMRARGEFQKFHEVSLDKLTWYPAGSVQELFPSTGPAARSEAFSAAPPTSAVPPRPEPAPSAQAPPRKRGPKKPGQTPGWVRRSMIWGGIAASVVLVAVAVYFLWPQDEKFNNDELATKSQEIFKQNCARCHDQKSSPPILLDPARLVSEKSGDLAFIAPGKLDQSAVWLRVKNDSMPPDGKKLTAAEKRIIEQWIVAGAPRVGQGDNLARSPRTVKDNLQAMNSYLAKMTPDRRFSQRFFVLTHLYNNPKVDNKELQLHRAAMSKLLNSLSTNPQIAVPIKVDDQGTVYAFDLNAVNWRPDVWEQIIRHYPYGLRYGEDDKELAQLEDDIERRTGTSQAYLRVDWFVANAARPLLYHHIMKIPKNAKVLETRLGVRVADNINNGVARRAGFSDSGVSRSNRLIERHTSNHGYYWKSYDFKGNNSKSDLFRFPLGPGNALNQFRHDGGEIIFSLPNGLQGYMLVDGNDEQIDEGPKEVVFDRNDSAKTGTIVNGLSCMSCHKDGVIKKYDEVRDKASKLAGQRAKVEELYAPRAELEGLYAKDEKKFKDALAEAYRGLVNPDELDSEPVYEVNGRFHRGLTMEDVVAELGISNAATLKQKLGERVFQDLGLGPLESGRAIGRESWESQQEDGFSKYQKTAAIAILAVPVRRDR